jgi:hypothetical protein
VNAGCHHRAVPPDLMILAGPCDSFSDKTPTTSRALQGRVHLVHDFRQGRCSFQRRLLPQQGDQTLRFPRFGGCPHRPTLTALMQAAGVVSSSRKGAVQLKGPGSSGPALVLAAHRPMGLGVAGGDRDVGRAKAGEGERVREGVER